MWPEGVVVAVVVFGFVALANYALGCWMVRRNLRARLRRDQQILASEVRWVGEAIGEFYDARGRWAVCERQEQDLLNSMSPPDRLIAKKVATIAAWVCHCARTRFATRHQMRKDLEYRKNRVQRCALHAVAKAQSLIRLASPIAARRSWSLLRHDARLVLEQANRALYEICQERVSFGSDSDLPPFAV